MSGGSYDYVYSRIQSAAENMLQQGPRTPQRVAFHDLLQRVAKAMHDVEWVDSGDYVSGDEDAAVEAALGGPAAMDAAVLRVLQDDLRVLQERMDALRTTLSKRTPS